MNSLLPDQFKTKIGHTAGITELVLMKKAGIKFERFFRVDGGDQSHFSGLGIWLFICKEIIEKHDGYITVESKLSRGSSFSFYLPLYSTAAAFKYLNVIFRGAYSCSNTAKFLLTLANLFLIIYIYATSNNVAAARQV